MTTRLEQVMDEYVRTLPKEGDGVFSVANQRKTTLDRSLEDINEQLGRCSISGVLIIYHEMQEILERWGDETNPIRNELMSHIGRQLKRSCDCMKCKL